MTHAITPPPELLQLWFDQHYAYSKGLNELLIEVARYGADQELEACCKLLEYNFMPDSGSLRAARRPKPPSAVAQAEALIERYEDGWCPSPAQWHVIREGLAEGRRTLEAMNDD
jgi:hypothetical protein